MKINAILFSISMILLAATCDAQEEIVKIEFTSLTRGAQKQLFITQDSVISVNEGRQEGSGVSKRQLPKEAWEDLLKTLKNVKVSSIDSLQSPTNKRAFDGARHSTIRVITKSGKEYSHGFDNTEPNAKLKPLMKKILEIENKP